MEEILHNLHNIDDTHICDHEFEEVEWSNISKDEAVKIIKDVIEECKDESMLKNLKRKLYKFIIRK